MSVLHKNAGGTVLDGATYTYDYAGNRLTKTNQLNGITEGYTYDPIYELTHVVQGATTTENYSYDFVGNRLSSLSVPSYNYNSSNQLTSTTTGSYTYDNNGNTLTDPSGKTYTWDYENRLKQVVVPGTGTVTFKYDPFGRRIQKSAPSGTTNYLYDGFNPLQEMDSSGSVLARHTQGSHIDEPFSELRSSTTSYYEQDGIGSSTSLTDPTGALATTYSYDSFGKLTASTGTLTNPFQYTSRAFDSETGLYEYRARYYDQTLGRFISEDPIGFGGGSNFYDYVRNSPTLLNDPLGMRWNNTGAPASPTTNTIVCNGLGGITVQIAINQDLEALHCLYTCVWAHEESHWKDAITNNPAVCHMAAAGVQVSSLDLQELNASEFAAYTIELNCLRGMLKHGCGKCKDAVRDRIRQITPVRNGYR